MFIALVTTNPAYKAAVLAAAFTTLTAAAGLRRMRVLLVGVAFIATFDVLLNFVSAHLGRSVLFALPDSIPAVGGPYTLEALAFGVSGALTIAAAILAAAPFSFLLAPSDVIDALPNALSRTGTAIAASLNLVPSVATSFAEVAEAQRLRGWRPRGPRSWAEVVVPVVLTSAESSIQLAESMEARGFASAPRTSFLKPRIDRGGWLVIATSGLAVAVFALAQAAGWVSDWYAYPLLAPPAVDLRGLAACLLLLTPVMIWRRRV
jgi:energy-coupling factor transport system permease protein